jgi:hypothetical protein
MKLLLLKKYSTKTTRRMTTNITAMIIPGMVTEFLSRASMVDVDLGTMSVQTGAARAQEHAPRMGSLDVCILRAIKREREGVTRIISIDKEDAVPRSTAIHWCHETDGFPGPDSVFEQDHLRDLISIRLHFISRRS